MAPGQGQGRKVFGVAFTVAVLAVGAFVGFKYFGPGSSVGEKKEPVSVNQPAPGPESPKPSPVQTPSAAPPVETPQGEPAPQPPVERPSPTPPPPVERPSPAPRQTTQTPPPRAAANAPGGVQILSTPPGARVVVDNDPALACTTPCNLDLGSGRHTLVATLDGYRRAPKIFNLPQDSNMNLMLERMMGRLSVRTTPPGATIYVNGEPRAEKTPAMFSLPAGKYHISVVREGLPKQEDDVVVRDGGIADLELNWGPR